MPCLPPNRLRRGDGARASPVNSAAKLAKQIEPADLSASKIKPLAQMHESFIMAVDDEGLLLIDQHVAHERICSTSIAKAKPRGASSRRIFCCRKRIDLTPGTGRGVPRDRERSRHVGV